MKVYAIVFSNYDPPEVGGLYEVREDAEREAERLNAEVDWDPWDVVEWAVTPPVTTPVTTLPTDEPTSDP